MSSCQGSVPWTSCKNRYQSSRLVCPWLGRLDLKGPTLLASVSVYWSGPERPPRHVPNLEAKVPALHGGSKMQALSSCILRIRVRVRMVYFSGAVYQFVLGILGQKNQPHMMYLLGIFGVQIPNAEPKLRNCNTPFVTQLQ